MYRQNIVRAVRPAIRQRAAFSTTTRAMAGGDTGAPRSTGAAHGDAFTKREKANEDYAIRMREKEKLLELRKRLAEQQDHLKKLEEHMYAISKFPPCNPIANPSPTSAEHPYIHPRSYQLKTGHMLI
ncbi:mitochondrial ATPase inhibitor, IATP-domain-containing protein [Halenospora varia]|nr:mitochondrial ATPase inhibitor, IATP-domain-containing protein [Halenospora varia]